MTPRATHPTGCFLCSGIHKRSIPNTRNGHSLAITLASNVAGFPFANARPGKKWKICPEVNSISFTTKNGKYKYSFQQMEEPLFQKDRFRSPKGVERTLPSKRKSFNFKGSNGKAWFLASFGKIKVFLQGKTWYFIYILYFGTFCKRNVGCLKNRAKVPDLEQVLKGAARFLSLPNCILGF